MDKDYRMVRLIDGTTIMGSIVVDKDFLRITDALELNTVKRETEFGMKDDSTLAPWLPFTDDKIFVIPRDKILVITQADKHISHYYEVILDKLEKAKANAKPVLSAEEMEKIYKLADQMDKMQKIDQRETHWSEEELIDLFGKKTIH
mgnify:FL=1|jgi:hypothetical protein|tara:strand:- start:717 stop:1157 length:441 start_codon:yes stop_codon:yes gene_type:complete